MTADSGILARFRAGRRRPAPIERRRDIRCAAVFQIAKLTTGTHEELCILLDVAPRGLKAEIYSPVEVGEHIAITLRTEHRLTGQVMWRDGPMIGVAFAEEVPVTAMLAHCSIDERIGHIRPPRLETRMPATLRVDGRAHAVELRNVSQAGMRLGIDHRLDLDAPCEVILPGLGTRRGAVRWARGGEAGIALDAPIGYPEFSAWRRGLRELAAAA